MAGLESVLAQWSRWLLEHRFSGDDALFRQTQAWLEPVRDKVLGNATLAGDETLLDVGCGDGMIGFGALPLLPDGQVIFSDIAPDAVTLTRTLAQKFDVEAYCQFIQADATTLSAIEPESIDVITTRSVLIYVHNVQQTFEAFYRVLKPSGMFSLFEPIHHFAQSPAPHLFYGYDVSDVQELADKVKAKQPTTHFDVHDLMHYAENAGFDEVNLEYVISSTREDDPERDFETVLDLDSIRRALTAEEATHFIAHLRAQTAVITPRTRHAVAYLWGEK